MGKIRRLEDGWNQVIRSGHRRVLAHGVFDILHPGHLEHLKEAKVQGDVLIVTITADKHVHKGPGRPVFNQNQRAEMLAALEIVDYVAIVDDPTALPAIEAIRPNVRCKGPDYPKGDDKIGEEELVLLEKYGGRSHITSGFTASSSALINGHMPTVSSEAAEFLSRVKAQHPIGDILGWLDRSKELSVVVIGEAITDRYVFVTPEGKSAKESIVCFREIRTEEYQGGAQIVTAHLREICGKVELDTSPVKITKTRWILEPFNQKLFEVADRAGISSWGEPDYGRLKESDLVMVADFGLGLIRDPKVAERIATASPYLALTVQSNSLNYGFNLFLKWPRADYLVLDEGELRLAYRSKEGELSGLVRLAKHATAAQIMSLTLGHQGCLINADTGTVRVPSLTDKVVDRMGAGDAFFAYTAPLARLGAPPDIIALVGSVAAAIKIGTIGNQVVEVTKVRQWLEGLLK